MTCLTNGRLAPAADLLRSPGLTLGYGTPFALSAAFKRVRGVRPSAYRIG